MVSRGWFISVHKGGVFKAVLGMKTALNIELEPAGPGFSAKAHIGISGMHIIPALITRFIFWQMIVPELWGLVQQAKLDNQALDVIAKSVASHTGMRLPDKGSAVAADLARTEAAKFCTSCGSKLSSSAKFCSACGAAVQS